MVPARRIVHPCRFLITKTSDGTKVGESTGWSAA
jgi:hypothetical protein